MVPWGEKNCSLHSLDGRLNGRLLAELSVYNSICEINRVSEFLVNFFKKKLPLHGNVITVRQIKKLP